MCSKYWPTGRQTTFGELRVGSTYVWDRSASVWLQDGQCRGCTSLRVNLSQAGVNLSQTDLSAHIYVVCRLRYFSNLCCTPPAPEGRNGTK